MAQWISPEVLKAVKKAQESAGKALTPEVLDAIEEMRDTVDSSLPEDIRTQDYLSEETIATLQRAYLESHAPIVQNEKLFDAIQQVNSIEEDLLPILENIDQLETVRIDAIRPLLEQTEVERAVENPREAVDEYSLEESTAIEGDDNIQRAWAASLTSSATLILQTRDQLAEQFTDDQIQAAIMVLGVIIFLYFLGWGAAAGLAAGALYDYDTARQAVTDSIQQASAQEGDTEGGEGTP